MSSSTPPVKPSQTTKSAVVSFMKYGPGVLMDDEIKPRQVPDRLSNSRRPTKARIDEPDTGILTPDRYPRAFTNQLMQLATLCVEVDQAKELLRTQVRRRQDNQHHRPRVRFAREVLQLDLDAVVSELKAQQKAQRKVVAAAADPHNNGASSSMDLDLNTAGERTDAQDNKQAHSAMEYAMEIDMATAKKIKKKRNRKGKKPRGSTLGAGTQDGETPKARPELKRKRSFDTVMGEDTPAPKKVKDALDLSDLARDLPAVFPTTRHVSGARITTATTASLADEIDDDSMAL